MKQVAVFLLSILSQYCFSQTNGGILNLMNTPKVAIGLPYYFKEVTFLPLQTEFLGRALVYSNKTIVDIKLPLDKSKHIYDYLQRNYNGSKTSTPIVLHISQLAILPSQVGKISATDTFKFQCEFRALYDNELFPLYTFNAKNVMGNFEEPNVVVENFLARAIQTAIKKFSNEFKQHKDWHAQQKSSAGSVDVKVNHNKIVNLKDSIRCAKGEKISADYYSVNTKPDAKEIKSSFILSYKAIAIDDNDKIKLSINTYSCLAKNRSYLSDKISSEKQSFLLEQQQVLFDMCTFYGLKLEKLLRNYPYSIGEYKSEMNKVYNEVNSEYIQMRKEYESESESNVTKISKWQQKIQAMYNQL